MSAMNNFPPGVFHVFLNFSSSICVTVSLFLRGLREKAKTWINNIE